jgi:hypothetical protein
MEGLLLFRVYPSDGFRLILIPDGNPSHEFPVLDGNPSSNMNSANDYNFIQCVSQLYYKYPIIRIQALLVQHDQVHNKKRVCGNIWDANSYFCPSSEIE